MAADRKVASLWRVSVHPPMHKVWITMWNG
jgi:hypothetical protein